MTVQVLKLFDPTPLTIGVAVLYTVPLSATGAVLGNGRIRFTNTDTVQHAVTAYGVPSGGTAATANAFLSAVVVAGNSYLDSALPELTAGGSVQALADTSGVVVVHCLAGVLFS